MNIENYLKVLVLIFLCFIEFTVTYKYVKIQNSDICPAKIVTKVLATIFKSGKKFSLGDYKESSMLIEQNWDQKTLAYLEPNCKFVVQTKNKDVGSGLYTVINKLNFRKENDTCVDYLIFSGGNRPVSKPICEKIGVKKNENDKDSLIFNEHDHEVEIQLHINKERTIYEPLELSIVVTQHTSCNGFAGEFQCDKNDTSSCISSEFQNDGVPNCLPPCNDEDGGCFQSAVTSEPLVPAISALTSMIFTMVGVGGCVWVCWKYWDCMKVSRMPRNNETRRTRNVPNMETHNLEVLQPATIDNNILRCQRTNSPPKEDMPPSYESLFPEPISR